MKLEFCKEFTLTTNDFYSNGNIKISSVLNLFQTVAGDHAELAGLGFDNMIKLDIVWMLTSLKCTIERQLKIGEKVKVYTNPQPKGRIGYVRDYYIYNDKNEECIKGSSFWCLVSFSKRTYLRPTFEYQGEFVDKKAYENDFERLKPFPVSQNPAYVCKILNTHIDRNGHTNNINYADFVINGLDQIPKIEEFEIKFVSETVKGDSLCIGYEKQDNIIYACGEKNEKTSFIAKITTK